MACVLEQSLNPSVLVFPFVKQILVPISWVFVWQVNYLKCLNYYIPDIQKCSINVHCNYNYESSNNLTLTEAIWDFYYFLHREGKNRLRNIRECCSRSPSKQLAGSDPTLILMPTRFLYHIFSKKEMKVFKPLINTSESIIRKCSVFIWEQLEYWLLANRLRVFPENHVPLWFKGGRGSTCRVKN